MGDVDAESWAHAGRMPSLFRTASKPPGSRPESLFSTRVASNEMDRLATFRVWPRNRMVRVQLARIHRVRPCWIAIPKFPRGDFQGRPCRPENAGTGQGVRSRRFQHVLVDVFFRVGVARRFRTPVYGRLLPVVRSATCFTTSGSRLATNSQVDFPTRRLSYSGCGVAILPS